MWNPDYHYMYWAFHLCFSCLGLISQHCAENGGSSCNSCENDEEDGDDPVTINAPPFSPNGGTQMPHGFVHTAYGIVNTRFPFVYSRTGYNGLGDIEAPRTWSDLEADIIFTVALTVSPPLLQEVQAELGCLLSRIRQYCDVQLSASLGGWWVFLWQKSTQVSLSIQSIFRSLALFAPSVT